MTSSRRIIKGVDAGDSVVSWSAPAVDAAALIMRPSDESRAEDAAAVLEEARRQGFEQGRAEGIAAGRAELEQQAELLRSVLRATGQPLQSLDQAFEEELLVLVSEIARQLVRRELHLDPAHVISIIREGLAALPSGATGIRVRLHPHDAEVVRELLQSDEAGRSWTIEPDPILEQGGCQIVSDTAQIDGRLDTRLARVIATMLEDERAGAE